MSRNAFAQCERDYNEAEERREQAKSERTEAVSRANACVRACAGIANPDDYEFARVLKLADAHRTACLKYENQRDELVAVVEDAIALLANEDGIDLAPKWAGRARAILTKVES